jgi:hypothetical protein
LGLKHSVTVDDKDDICAIALKTKFNILKWTNRPLLQIAFTVYQNNAFGALQARLFALICMQICQAFVSIYDIKPHLRCIIPLIRVCGKYAFLRFHMGMCIPDGLVYNGELHALPCGNQQE